MISSPSNEWLSDHWDGTGQSLLTSLSVRRLSHDSQRQRILINPRAAAPQPSNSLQGTHKIPHSFLRRAATVMLITLMHCRYAKQSEVMAFFYSPSTCLFIRFVFPSSILSWSKREGVGVGVGGGTATNSNSAPCISASLQLILYLSAALSAGSLVWKVKKAALVSEDNAENGKAKRCNQRRRRDSDGEPRSLSFMGNGRIQTSRRLFFITVQSLRWRWNASSRSCRKHLLLGGWGAIWNELHVLFFNQSSTS